MNDWYMFIGLVGENMERATSRMILIIWVIVLGKSGMGDAW